jgi:hypothetical protein
MAKCIAEQHQPGYKVPFSHEKSGVLEKWLASGPVLERNKKSLELFISKSKKIRASVVAHTCNPSFLKASSQDCDLRPAQAKS